MRSSIRSYRPLLLLALLALLLASCGQQGTTGAPETAATPRTGVSDATPAIAPGEAATAAPAAGGGAQGTIKVGSKDFTEEFIVAEMYAQLLEDAGFTVEKKLNLGGTPVAHTAITNGEIDLYPEYTSTGLLEVLKKEPIKDANQIVETIRKEYEAQYKLTWLAPSPFNDSNTFAVTQDTATKYNLKTFSDLFAKASELRLGGPAEFPERGDTKNLEQIYGVQISSFKEYKQLGTGSLRYDALKSGDVDVVIAFGTDGRIKGDKLVVLQDDKGAYPIYNIAPVVRQDTLQKYPQISELLNKLAPLLTDDVMSGLNYQVDGPDKMEPSVVAKAFLEQQGLLTK
jgi:osmoprotectant transport system substrate-binding protein